MKALKLRNPFGLDHTENCDLAEAGAPAAGEIRVRLHACSLNYHDYAVATGQIATADGRIPMADGAGVVEDIGPDVTEFAPGDHVVSTFFPQWHDGRPPIADFSTTPGDGIDGYAREAVTVPAEFFTRAPKGFDHVQAATLTTAGVTAWRALVVKGRLKAGDTVLVLGTGGVSIFALQIAKAMGATVFVTSSSDEKLERAQRLGADHIINYKKTEDWGRRVFELTGGGVDHVIEVGGPGTLAQSIAAGRIGGHISLIGVLTGWEGKIPTAALMIKQQDLRGIIVGSRRHQIEFVRAIEFSGIKPVVDRIFGLNELGEAYRYEESGKHFGKICLSF